MLAFLTGICIYYVTRLWFRQLHNKLFNFLRIFLFFNAVLCDLHPLSGFRIILLMIHVLFNVICVAAPVELFLLLKGMVRISISPFGNGWKKKWWREKVLQHPNITSWLFLMISTTKLQVVVSLRILQFRSRMWHFATRILLTLLHFVKKISMNFSFHCLHFLCFDSIVSVILAFWLVIRTLPRARVLRACSL